MIITVALSSPYLYDLFTSGSSLPPTIPVSKLEQELSKANIALSEGDVQQVRKWLSGDPAYQALAQSCLKILAGKRVSDPVPLDVVNARYVEALGYSSEEYIGPGDYNELGKLKGAIYDAWKERHAGLPQNSFDEIVENISTAR